MDELGQGNARLAVPAFAIDNKSLRTWEIERPGKFRPGLLFFRALDFVQGNSLGARDVPSRKIVTAAAVDEQESCVPLHFLSEQILRLAQGDEPDACIFPAINKTLPELAGSKPAEQREMEDGAEDDAKADDRRDPADKAP